VCSDAIWSFIGSKEKNTRPIRRQKAAETLDVDGARFGHEADHVRSLKEIVDLLD
jgi:hypothetical protein